MTRLLTLTAGLSLLLAVGCKSAPKNSESTDLKPDVTDTALAGGATGSDSGKIPGLHTVHFEFDRAVLDSEGRKLLAENATWLEQHPEVDMQVEGHCDSTGSTEYNLALGDRRARAVGRALEELGIAHSRLTLISYGEERPVDTGDTPEAYAHNRRVNFVPMPRTVKNPIAKGSTDTH